MQNAFHIEVSWRSGCKKPYKFITTKHSEERTSLRKLSAIAFLSPDEMPDAFKALSVNAPEEVLQSTNISKIPTF